MTEIGASAFQLQTTMQMRKDVFEGRTRIRRIDDDGAEQEEDLDDGKLPVYPRGMLKLELSDGRRRIRAMEYRRLDGLRLGDTPLGCKVGRSSERHMWLIHAIIATLASCSSSQRDPYVL